MAAAHRHGDNDSRLRGLLDKIPGGRVAAISTIADELALAPRAVETMLRRLGAAGETALPWHRIVADGGAIGRHALRDVQIARLKAEGVPVSPAGIVQEFGARRMANFAEGGHAGPTAGAKVEAAAPGPSRSRGMIGQPSSTVKR